jgi:hypothetical protein
MKIILLITEIIKKLPEFLFTSEKLDVIIWNDKKGNCFELRLFGKHIGYF